MMVDRDMNGPIWAVFWESDWMSWRDLDWFWSPFFDIEVFYELSGFHQNHRLYVDSRVRISIWQKAHSRFGSTVGAGSVFCSRMTLSSWALSTQGVKNHRCLVSLQPGVPWQNTTGIETIFFLVERQSIKVHWWNLKFVSSYFQSKKPDGLKAFDNIWYLWSHLIVCYCCYWAPKDPKTARWFRMISSVSRPVIQRLKQMAEAGACIGILIFSWMRSFLKIREPLQNGRFLSENYY